MSPGQRQIVMGTVLGGSSVVRPAKGKNSYLFMRGMNEAWLRYKSFELRAFAPQQPFTTEQKTIRWHSNCYPVFNEFRQMFYPTKAKELSMDILDQLTGLGLSVWYGDAGRLVKRRIQMNTHKLGREASEVAAQYFCEVGIEAEVMIDRKSYRVLFSEGGTEKFLALAGVRLPDFMGHLLPG